MWERHDLFEHQRALPLNHPASVIIIIKTFVYNPNVFVYISRKKTYNSEQYFGLTKRNDGRYTVNVFFNIFTLVLNTLY